MSNNILENFFKEYIALRDLPNGGIKKDTVVINVLPHYEIDGHNQHYHSGYDFTVKDTGKKGWTYYDWILIENSPENLKLLKQYREMEETIEKLEAQKEELFSRIETAGAIDPNIGEEELTHRDDFKNKEPKKVFQINTDNLSPEKIKEWVEKLREHYKCDRKN